jgi:hypothetical protein
MSVIKVNNITSRDGTTGPVIAGIATVSTTSHLVVPTGNTGQKVPLAPDPFINNLVLALPFNSESVFDDVSPKSKGTFSGRGSIGFATTTASLPFGVSGVTTTSVGIVTFSKYYGTSVGFNTSISSTQALQNNNTSDYQFGIDDFTIEFWIYIKNFSHSFFPLIIKCSDDSSWNNGWSLSLRSTGTIYWRSNSDNWTTTSTYSTNIWYHIAVVRKNLTRSLYVNGILERSDYDSNSLVPTTQISIGNDISSNYPLDGYLQDLRIYKGVAKYTSNFTPPTQIAL